jgi:hypothetical protein
MTIPTDMENAIPQQNQLAHNHTKYWRRFMGWVRDTRAKFLMSSKTTTETGKKITNTLKAVTVILGGTAASLPALAFEIADNPLSKEIFKQLNMATTFGAIDAFIPLVLTSVASYLLRKKEDSATDAIINRTRHPQYTFEQKLNTLKMDIADRQVVKKLDSINQNINRISGLIDALFFDKDTFCYTQLRQTFNNSVDIATAQGRVNNPQVWVFRELSRNTPEMVSLLPQLDTLLKNIETETKVVSNSILGLEHSAVIKEAVIEISKNIDRKRSILRFACDSQGSLILESLDATLTNLEFSQNKAVSVSKIVRHPS